MKLQVIRIVMSIIAFAFVMIAHEFPKAYAFSIANKDRKSNYSIFKLQHYIDPIGMIFFIIFGAGFSKPYMYRIKDRKTNLRLGLLGFTTLAFICCISLIILKYHFGMTSSLTYNTLDPMSTNAIKFLLIYIARSSIGMFIVNLFPIASFNMGLCIAGKSPIKFFAILRSDFLFKMILLFASLLGVVTNIGDILLLSLLN